MPSVGTVAVKELSGAIVSRPSGWSSMLADVVDTDRDECVGGTLTPARPVVPSDDGAPARLPARASRSAR